MQVCFSVYSSVSACVYMCAHLCARVWAWVGDRDHHNSHAHMRLSTRCREGHPLGSWHRSGHWGDRCHWRQLLHAAGVSACVACACMCVFVCVCPLAALLCVTKVLPVYQMCKRAAGVKSQEVWNGITRIRRLGTECTECTECTMH